MLRQLSFLLLLAFSAGCIFCTEACGGAGRLGGVSVNLPPPAGFCELSDSQPADKHMLTVVRELAKPDEKLLSMSADCEQLAGWREHQRTFLDNYAQYMASLDQIDSAPDLTIQQACAELRGNGSKISSKELKDLKARLAEVLSTVKINQSAFIGVLAEEPRACYAGIIDKLRTEPGTDKTQLTLVAVTAVKNRRVFVERFQIYTGRDSVVSGLAKLKKDVAAFYAAN